MSNEMEELKKHFEKLEHGQEKLHAQNNLLEDSLKELKGAIIGNAPMGQKGLAQRMEDVEDRQTEVEEMKGLVKRVETLEERQKETDQIKYKVMGASAVIGGLCGFLAFIISILVKFWDKIF